MDAPLRPPTRTVLLRAIGGRCPACGEGRIFDGGGFRRADRCTICDWPLERGEGHWLGGSEICMIATFWIACIAFIVLHRFVPLSAVTMVFAGAGTVTIALVTYRRSRSVFVAFDFLADPVPDTGSPPGDRDLRAPAPRFPGPAPVRTADNPHP